MITFEEFEALANDCNVIPLIRTSLADLHTPVTAYLSLRKAGRPSFLFESVESNEKIGRYSFAGVDPLVLLCGDSGGTDIIDQGVRTRSDLSIFDVLESITSRYRQAASPAADGFLGGFVGYIGYPAVAHLERLTVAEPGFDEEEESLFGLFGSLVRFDHRQQTITIVHNVMIDGKQSLRGAYDEGRKAVDALALKLRRPIVAPNSFACDITNGDANADRSSYCAAVTRAQRYIVEGDIFQVVLSRRVRHRFTGDLFSAYRALRMINPSPYLFFVDFGETQLAGSSPEALVRVRGEAVETLPIAGTRQRGNTAEEDWELEQQLLSDPKELAEHVMLVDLSRNDVGRVSRYGSVGVPVFKRIERCSHVMHIVSEVRGRLRDGLTALDALKGCFPAGTVSGAPKIRAMEIIAELEGASRGAYGGAVGYVGLNGSLDMCIAIRTIVGRRGVLSIQAGAGIVADSVPEIEFEETINKSRALLEAVRAAAAGFGPLDEGGTHPW